MQTPKDFVQTHKRGLLNIIALLGGVAYLLQSWYFIHNLDSVLDEGAYLLKGLLFVRGVYSPFQDYGPLTNHMPLSFLIHGVVQALFGPGLRPARYFVLLLGLFTLLGLWVVVRRFRGEGWAAAAVWTIALNPAVIKMYSVATSQVLIVCLLVWVFALVLGESRKFWQLVVGAGLSGIILLTRINLAPVLPLVLLYIFWQHGKRAAIWATVAGAGVLVVGHAFFWPGILKIWAYWLPNSLAPFLAPWREPAAVRYWNPGTDFNGRAISFFHGFRFHFVALWGALTTWLLWPRRKMWKSEQDFRMAVLFSGLLLILGAMHAYASLGLTYCVYCYPVYLSFFDFCGTLLFLIALPSLVRKPHFIRQTVTALLILFITTGVAYSALSDFKHWGEEILKSNAPRLANFRILPGTVKLWVLLENRFGWSYETQWRNFIPATGLAIGFGILVLALLVWLIPKLRKAHTQISPAISALSLVLVAGMIFSPTLALGDGFQTYDCGQVETELSPQTADENVPEIQNPSQDVIQSYEAAGQYLASLIRAGSKVYWRGTLSAVPLLYLDDPQLFPSQINQDYTLYLTGDDTELEAYGFWSNSLAQKWVQEADFVLVAKRYYTGWLADTLGDGKMFEEHTPTLPVAPCDARSVIHIFERIP